MSSDCLAHPDTLCAHLAPRLKLIIPTVLSSKLLLWLWHPSARMQMAFLVLAETKNHIVSLKPHFFFLWSHTCTWLFHEPGLLWKILTASLPLHAPLIKFIIWNRYRISKSLVSLPKFTSVTNKPMMYPWQGIIRCLHASMHPQEVIPQRTFFPVLPSSLACPQVRPRLSWHTRKMRILPGPGVVMNVLPTQCSSHQSLQPREWDVFTLSHWHAEFAFCRGGGE